MAKIVLCFLSQVLAIVMQEMSLSLVLSSVILSTLIWLGLLGWRGGFWRSDIVLEEAVILESNKALKLDNHSHSIHPFTHPPLYPSICAVIPARNEADLLPVTLRSLLSQTFTGTLTVILVDDHSSDETATVAQQTAEALGKSAQLQILTAPPLPAGWSGKLWAMHHGIQAAKSLSPAYILFTDADVEHDPANLQRLVTQATCHDLDMASIMVRLRCDSFWEKLLIPAFVFFFEKLYPFRWVNAPDKTVAAAAGGCILIRQTALDRIGGIESIRQALIDDCALAQAVKGSRGNRRDGEGAGIWLGLSDCTRSLRPYPSLATIWDMVARTAFTQLDYSVVLLSGTIIGMTILYLMAPLALLIGLGIGDQTLVSASLINWSFMTLAYYPTVRFYRCTPLLSVSLPLIAFLYTLMTLDSAVRYWQGCGSVWKGRTYSS